MSCQQMRDGQDVCSSACMGCFLSLTQDKKGMLVAMSSSLHTRCIVTMGAMAYTGHGEVVHAANGGNRTSAYTSKVHALRHHVKHCGCDVFLWCVQLMEAARYHHTLARHRLPVVNEDSQLPYPLSHATHCDSFARGGFSCKKHFLPDLQAKRDQHDSLFLC